MIVTQPIAHVKEERMLVDTGACRTVFRKDAFPGTQAQQTEIEMDLRTITDERIQQFGEKNVSVTMPGGRNMRLRGQVTDVGTSALSIGASNQSGLTAVFGPSGAYLSKTEPPIPLDAQKFEKEGNLFYMRVKENYPIPTTTLQKTQWIAPAVDASQQQEMGDGHLVPFDADTEQYYSAIDRGEAVPFRIHIRRVENARQHRVPIATDPCRWSQVFRRVTRDADTRELLQDIRKDEPAADFNWTAFVPGGPRNLEIEFHYTDQIEDDATLLELIGPAAPEEDAQVLLDVPQRPDMNTVMRHNLTHCDYASWCEHCRQGRGRGPLHHGEPLIGEDRFEMDYTYWSQAGLPTNTEDGSAACSLTIIQRKTGMPEATVVERKGPWPYAIALAASFINVCSRETELVIRGDGEHALQQLIRHVAEKLVRGGKTVKVESTAVASHQSIGGAERCHESIGNIVRVLVSYVQHHSGYNILPKTRLFPWVIRHSAYLLGHHYKRREGVTPFRILNGHDVKDKLAPFGECVQAKVADIKKQGKSAPRWFRGIYVGVSEINATSIVLTESGYVTTRVISRLAAEAQWDAEFLGRVCGSPWSRTEGIKDNARLRAVQSDSTAEAIPMGVPLLTPPTPKGPDSSSSDSSDSPGPQAGRRKRTSPSSPSAAGPLPAGAPANATPPVAPVGPAAPMQVNISSRGGTASPTTSLFMPTPPLPPAVPATPGMAAPMSVSSGAAPTPPLLPNYLSAPMSPGQGGAASRTPRRTLAPGVVVKGSPSQKRSSDLGIEQYEFDMAHALRGSSAASASSSAVPPKAAAAASSSAASAPAVPISAPGTAPVPGPKARTGGVIGGLIQYDLKTADVPKDNGIYAVEDALQWLDVRPDRHATRLVEIEKLENFQCFFPKYRSELEPGAWVYEYLWVETPGKSRLTLQDRRTYGDPDEITHCPTPSAETNNLMEYISIHYNMPMWVWDVVSAYPHSPESRENVYMRPPKEWNYHDKDKMVWWMRSALYGRRSAGANFRDFLEEIIMATPMLGMVRGVTEPCCYCSSTGEDELRLTHHIDDGRIVANREHGPLMISHLATFMLLKVSRPILPGTAVKHLGRTKIRLERGWVTIPDGKHVTNVFQRIGYGTDRAPGRSVPTPGVKRVGNEVQNMDMQVPEQDFRSAVGSLIYFALDIELLAYTVK